MGGYVRLERKKEKKVSDILTFDYIVCCSCSLNRYQKLFNRSIQGPKKNNPTIENEKYEIELFGFTDQSYQAKNKMAESVRKWHGLFEPSKKYIQINVYTIPLFRYICFDMFA